MHADHCGQTVGYAGLKCGLVSSIVGIGASCLPVTLACRASITPEVVFRPEQYPQLVAGIAKGWVLRIVRAADKVESGLFDHLHVAKERGICHTIAPARVILVNIGAVKVVMRAIQREPTSGRPTDPAEAKRRGKVVYARRALRNCGDRAVERRVIRVPERRIGNRRRGLLNRHRAVCRHDLGGRHGGHRRALRVHNVGLQGAIPIRRIVVADFCLDVHHGR